MFTAAQKLHTQEINAAVRGAKAGGATEIVVMDCHGAGGGWTFNSLVAEDLDRLGARRPAPVVHAALCGTWGCPVLLATGDQASCDEGRVLLGPSLTTVAVKQGLGGCRLG